MSDIRRCCGQSAGNVCRAVAATGINATLFDSPLDLPEQFTFTADTHKQLLSKRFQNTTMYLGRLTSAEQRLLFPEKAIESVALMLLGDNGDLGMLAIGSDDASHFEPPWTSSW